MKHVFLFFLTAVFGIFAGTAWHFFGDFFTPKKPADISCDITQKSCTKNGVTFEFATRPVEAMRPLILRLSNLNAHNASVKIYGLNMNMGVVESTLVKNGEVFETKVVLSTCTQKEMIYRIELFNAGKPLGITADFVLKN